MRNPKPAGLPKRRAAAEAQSGIPSMARRKRGSCSSVTIGIFLMIIILIVLLAASGIIPAPVVRKTTPLPSPSFTSTAQPAGEVSATPNEVRSPTATWTALPSLTSTPTPTLTPNPSKTPTLTPTATEKSMPFVMRGTPEGLSHTLFHPEYSCEDYLFIGGQVWDLQDSALQGLVLRLGGTYGGDIVDMTAESGSALIYGRSGYEFALKNKKIAETNIYIQLEDKHGEALSARTFLNVTASCQANLIIVNYKQVR